MKRLLIGEVMVAVLAVAGCGVAHSATTHPRPGAAAARSASHRAPAAKGWLPALTASQVATGRLVSRPWTLVRLAHGGTVAEVSYSFGGCQPRPNGVLVTESGSSVRLSLEAPRLHPGTMCTPDLLAGTAQVRLPALAGRPLQHAPTSH